MLTLMLLGWALALAGWSLYIWRDLTCDEDGRNLAAANLRADHAEARAETATHRSVSLASALATAHAENARLTIGAAFCPEPDEWQPICDGVVLDLFAGKVDHSTGKWLDGA